MRIRLPLLVLGALLLALLVPARADAGVPLEPYASYQPQTRCAPKAKPGTVMLGHWMVNRYGGRFGGISRACGSGGQSEHKEGRAFDWSVDVNRQADRVRVARFLREILATDAAGNPHALARRMGIMYVIWNDRIYSAWDGFRGEPYLHVGCKRLTRCSPTLRHRDHLHVSLTRQAALTRTSWYSLRL